MRTSGDRLLSSTGCSLQVTWPWCSCWIKQRQT